MRGGNRSRRWSLRAFWPWLSTLLLCGACFVHEAIEPPALGAIEVAAPQTVRWVAVGDTGLGNRTQHQVARAMARVCEARGCDFAMLLGDNLYPRGMQSPDDPRMDEVLTEVYRRLDLPVYAVLGNHDWGRGRDAQAAKWQVEWANRSEIMQMPARYYSFSAGPAEFFALDTTPIFWRADPSQRAWLEARLGPSTAPFRVVFGHHAYRSDARHGNAGNYEGLGWLPIVGGAQLGALFDAQLCAHADLYVAGHDHNLQWIRHCGTELVVSGAGASTRPIEDRGNSPLFAADTVGFAWIALSVSEEGARATTIAFYDADGALLHEGSRSLPPRSPALDQRHSSP